MSQTFIVEIRDLKLAFEPYNLSRFKDFLGKNEGKKVRIELAKNPVSDELRGYYWGAVIPTAKSAVKEWEDITDDELHEVLKKLFNYFDFYNPLTKRKERCGRSAMSGDSNSARAMDFIEGIRKWLGEEYYIELPSPEEYKKKRDEFVTPGKVEYPENNLGEQKF